MWSVAISEIAKAIAEIFNYKETATERQSETNVIKKSKNKDKACNVAEEIIFIADKFIADTDEKTQRKYARLRKKFFKYN